MHFSKRIIEALTNFEPFNASNHTTKKIHCKAQTHGLDYSFVTRQTLKLMVLKVFKVISFAQRHRTELINNRYTQIRLLSSDLKNPQQ